MDVDDQRRAGKRDATVKLTLLGISADGDIDHSTLEIIDGDDRAVCVIETVGKSGGGGFVDDMEEGWSCFGESA